MSKLIKRSVLLKSLFTAMIILAALTFTATGTSFAAPPPFGITLDNMWAYEDADSQIAYSMSPIPAYTDDDTYGPNFTLAQGAEFKYYYSKGVEIFEILEWNPGEPTIFGPIYQTNGDGSYRFYAPGMYMIIFGKSSSLSVNVTRSSAPSTVVTPKEEIKVFVDSTPLFFDVPPQIVNGRTLVPLRVIFEELEASVDWNEKTQTITAVRDNTTISLQIGNKVLMKNGVPITLDVPAQLINKRTMVPTRAIAEAFNAEVKWDSVAQTVLITTN